LITEFNYNEDQDILIQNGRVENFSSTNQNSIYTAKGVDKQQLQNLLSSPKFIKNGLIAVVAVTAGIAVGTPTSVFIGIFAGGYFLIQAVGGAINIKLINSADASEIAYGSPYPSSQMEEYGGKFLSDYKGIQFTSNYRPAVILYDPRLVPNDYTMNIVCDFICPISNYRNGSLFHQIQPENQVTDTAVVFFNRNNGQTLATKHRGVPTNVSISGNVVSGQFFISNVWLIDKDWTLDSLEKEFSAIRFYAGFRPKSGGGFGPFSNEPYLLRK
jgi:hypothetical protein